MNKIARIVTGISVSVALIGGAAACTYTGSDEVENRNNQAKEAAAKDTLEKKNLRKKIDLENDPNRIGYVYLLSFGKPYGYYVVKGKISSSGSQLEPEDQIIRPYSGEYVSVDGPQDDGTYGTGDPGIFFFTPEGNYVETSSEHFYSSQPVPTALDVPKLGN
jgi:hypothetical protein